MKDNVTEVINRIALSSDNDERMRSIQQKHVHIEGAKISYVRKKKLNVIIQNNKKSF